MTQRTKTMADNLQIHFLAPEHVETARQFSFTGG